MIHAEETTRIIGDFIELNADIIFYKYLIKGPKWYRTFRTNQKYKRLLNALEEFHKSKFILTYQNVAELFIYIYNNFPPKGSYNSIKSTKIVGEDARLVYGDLSFENCIAYITINRSTGIMDIDAKMKKPDGSSNGCHISLSSLKTDNALVKDIIDALNRQLIEEIYNYIYFTIDQFRKDPEDERKSI